MGEQELARHFIAEGFAARRGQQHRGGPDAPDVIVSDLPWLHVECKRTETLSLYPALGQAMADAGDRQLPVVCHRRSNFGWVAVLDLDDFLSIVRNTPNVGPGTERPGFEVITEEEAQEEHGPLAQLFKDG